MNQPKNKLSELLEQNQASDPETPEPSPTPKSYQSPVRQGKKMISGYFDPAVQHQLQVIKPRNRQVHTTSTCRRVECCVYNER